MGATQAARYGWAVGNKSPGIETSSSNSSSITAMKIHALGPDSKHLPAVQKLWRAHSDTLGYLTDGAFSDYAHQKTILAAITPTGELAGYLLYRRSYDKAVIVHLCVDAAWRGQKLGRLLVDALVERTKN